MTRRRAATVLTAVVVVAALAACSASTTGPSASSTVATAAPGPPDPDAVGISLGNGVLDDDGATLERDLDAIAATGVTWLRVDVDWSVTEPTRGSDDWSRLDRVVAAAKVRRLHVLALLAYTPAWARPAGTTDKHPPTDPADLAAFAALAAGRFADRVDAWEVWNEPNSARFWAPEPSSAAYAALSAAVVPAIRAADPSATVVLGGLAPAVDARDGSEIAPATFVRQLIRRGAVARFDAVGVHPYSFPALPTDASTAAWNSFVRLPLVHDELVRAGLARRPVWITEVGAPTGRTDRSVTDAVQADIVVASVRAAQALPWVQRTFVFSHRDASADRVDVTAQFGLRRYDGSPKPASDALTALLHP